MSNDFQNDGPSDLAATARAFATYSLVPYLGIIFCPGALLVSAVGLVRYRANGSLDDLSRNVCYQCLLIGIVIFTIQSVLWWILYRVPIWAKGL